MRSAARWVVRIVVVTAAVCGLATLAAATFATAEAARSAEAVRPDTQDPLHVQPLAVSPNKPPLDAGRDGGAQLPPVPDAKMPFSDASDTPM
jgi:hypothetical protein